MGPMEVLWDGDVVNPPPYEQTDADKNITFRRTTYTGGNNPYHWFLDALYAAAVDGGTNEQITISTGVIFKFSDKLVDRLDSYDTATGKSRSSRFLQKIKFSEHRSMKD